MCTGSRILFCLTLLLGAHAFAIAQTEYSLAACDSPDKAKKMVGGILKLTLSKDAIVKKGRDVDYSDYAIGFGKKDRRVWLRGIFGPTATSGRVPDDWLSTSTEVTQRKWKFDVLEGVDVKGKLPNGNYWRYFGMYGESMKYFDVPSDAAAYFDGIINGLCIHFPSQLNAAP